VHLDAEVVRLDGERGLRAQPVVQVVDELEALHEHAQHQRGLLQGELPSDAGTLAGAEGLVGVGRGGGEPLGCHVVGVELGGVRAPHRRGPVQCRREHGERRVRGDGVTAADHGVLERRAGEPRRGRPEPQGLLEDLPHVAQPVDLLERRLGRGAEDGVDLGGGKG
jgi:hypothetical protein